MNAWPLHELLQIPRLRAKRARASRRILQLAAQAKLAARVHNPAYVAFVTFEEEMGVVDARVRVHGVLRTNDVTWGVKATLILSSTLDCELQFVSIASLGTRTLHIKLAVLSPSSAHTLRRHRPPIPLRTLDPNLMLLKRQLDVGDAQVIYSGSWLQRIFMNRRLKLRGRRIGISEAPEPSTILWENYGFGG